MCLTNVWCIHSFQPANEHTFAKHRDTHGRCIAILFKVSLSGRVDATLLRQGGGKSPLCSCL